MATHDNAYKNIFSHRHVVVDLLNGFVNEDWVRAVDLSTLDRLNGSFVSDDLSDREDDLIWRVRRGDEVAYVYLLLEFQSRADPWMALRLMVYIGMLYQELIKSGELKLAGRSGRAAMARASNSSGRWVQSDHLPVVFPIDIYNGEKAWAAPRDVAELIEPLPGGLTAYRPSLRYHLLDKGRTPIRAEDNTVSDLIDIESAPDPEQVQDIVARISQRWAGRENAEVRRALAVWIRRVVLARLGPDIDLPPITELAEVEAMLSGNVIPWNVTAMEKGIQQGLEKGR